MRVISPLSININQVSHILQVTCILQISCILKCKFLDKLNPQTSISTNILIIFILLFFVCLILNTFNLQCKDIKKWVNSKLILFYFVLNGFFCIYAAVFKD